MKNIINLIVNNDDIGLRIDIFLTKKKKRIKQNKSKKSNFKKKTKIK